MTPKEKLDKALGISSGKSVDDFLSDLDLNEENSREVLSKVEGAIKESVEEIAGTLQEIKDPSDIDRPSLASDIQKSFNDINELVGLSKKIINHLYTDIVSSELVDSELIASTASFIQATHENIKEYVEIYRDQLRFFNSIKLEMLRHENKKREMELKHKYDMEKISASNPLNETPENMKVFDQEGIVKALKNIEV